MKRIEITTNWPFTSYPNGKDARLWKKGDEDVVSNDHAELLVETKGRAKYAAVGAQPLQDEPAPPAAPDPAPSKAKKDKAP